MELYNVPNNTRIRIKGFEEDGVLLFHHIDGMYSYCTDENGDVVHIPAWAEVNIKGGW